MKRRFWSFGFSFLIVLALAMLLSNTVAQNYGNQMLKGTYGFTLDGMVYSAETEDGSAPSAPVRLTMLGQIVADGNGAISEGLRTVTFDGVVIQDTVEGSYSVNPNGMGTLTLDAFFQGEKVAVEVFDCFFFDTGKQFECTLSQVTLLPEGTDMLVGLVRGIRQ